MIVSIESLKIRSSPSVLTPPLRPARPFTCFWFCSHYFSGHPACRMLELVAEYSHSESRAACLWSKNTGKVLGCLAHVLLRNAIFSVSGSRRSVQNFSFSLFARIGTCCLSSGDSAAHMRSNVVESTTGRRWPKHTIFHERSLARYSISLPPKSIFSQ
jgi:hypothetical protein